MAGNDRIPVTVLTGFLGAGKTTRRPIFKAAIAAAAASPFAPFL